MFLSLIIVTIILSGCSMSAADETIFEKYCEEFPGDIGCMNDSDPTGIFDGDSYSCNEGYVLEGTECVLEDNYTDDIVICETGYHIEDEQCVQDEVEDVCEGDLILNQGICIYTCELPIDDIDYYPCFRECNDDFTCSYHKLVLTGGNSYFESFIMWIKHTNMNDSSEFELHYVLKGETEVIVNTGGIDTWCVPSYSMCEDLYKSNFIVSQSTGEIKYKFSFWYDEYWYTEVQEVYYDVWNSETNDYDRIVLDLQFFYLQAE